MFLLVFSIFLLGCVVCAASDILYELLYELSYKHSHLRALSTHSFTLHSHTPWCSFSSEWST